MKDYDKEYLDKVFEEIGSWPQDQVTTSYFSNGKEIELDGREDNFPEVDEESMTVETNFFEDDDSIFYQIKANAAAAVFTEFDENGEPKVQITLTPDEVSHLLQLDKM